jgi:hypothetical protein
LQDERGTNWLLPQLPSSYFASEIFVDYYKALNDFVEQNLFVQSNH